MVFPEYFPAFSCIAGACQHSCCIGWEIDIDANTAEQYRAIANVQREIVWENPPHFRLKEYDRCPFLNGENLCDLILEFGEDVLCDICREHPRFYNDLPNRVETGLGLCCEEAARLILTWKSPVKLQNAQATDDELLLLREELIVLAQDRTKSIGERMECVLSRVGGAGVDLDFYALLAPLERLSAEWDRYLEYLKKPCDINGFFGFIKARESEYEQLLVYFLYRYFALAFDAADATARARFAVFACTVIWRIGCAIWTEKHEFSVVDQVELVRMFSSEIEYSEENIERLLDELYA